MIAAMHSVDHRVGQLLEIRAASPFTLDDASALFKQIYRVMPRDSGLARVIVDLRGLRVVDPAVVDLVTGFMQMDNPMVERNAFLLPESGSLVQMQSERMLKQVGSPSRRAFRHRQEAEDWMAEILTPAEHARLIAFLNEGGVY
jgi:hypothetical protein